MLLSLAMFVPFLPAAACQPPAAGTDEPVVTVAQDPSGDFHGTDDTPIREAIKAVRRTGGIVRIEPGTYLVRRTIFVPGEVTLRGSNGTVLRLPSPVTTTEAAAAGSTSLTVADAGEFAPSSLVELLPPEGSEFFPDGETRSIPYRKIAAVEPRRIELVEPLQLDLPAGSRVGYAHNIVSIRETNRVTVENLTFDGGLVEGIPMPGHHLRTALWVSSPSGAGERERGEPVSEVSVKHCVFRDCYGRGVAFYNAEDSVVAGCRFANIADEAIDFDHYSTRCRAVGNDVRDAIWGISLNDAIACVVEHNRVARCGKGIFVWWWKETPKEGVNERNVIRHNTVTGSSEEAIYVGQHCHRNEIVQNFVDGEIYVEEETNLVADNYPVEAGD